MYQEAAEKLGFAKKHNADWFNDNEEEIQLAIELRNKALKANISTPTTENLRKLREARIKLQRDMRRIEDDWWLRKAVDLQRAADENNSAGFFSGLKEVYGLQAQLSNSLLDKDGSSIITNQKKNNLQLGAVLRRPPKCRSSY